MPLLPVAIAQGEAKQKMDFPLQCSIAHRQKNGKRFIKNKL
jgi:hypothetical protein